VSVARTAIQVALQVLRETVPCDKSLIALEIASGTGTHVGYFAHHLPLVSWQPSECDPANLDSIKAYKDEQDNILEPLLLDVIHPVDIGRVFDFILNINMIHISPWSATLGLFANANKLLRTEGFLITYGPYSEAGVLKPESNVQFDTALRQMNSEWGIRDVQELEAEAARERLELVRVVDMPANNKMLIFMKR